MHALYVSKTYNVMGVVYRNAQCEVSSIVQRQIPTADDEKSGRSLAATSSDDRKRVATRVNYIVRKK